MTRQEELANNLEASLVHHPFERLPNNLRRTKHVDDPKQVYVMSNEETLTRVKHGDLIIVTRETYLEVIKVLREGK